MKGKYVNTVIMMAAKSGRRTTKAVNAETLAHTGDHKIIWSKNRQEAINRLERVRTQEALSC